MNYSENKENEYIFNTGVKPKPTLREQKSYYSFKKNIDIRTDIKNLDSSLNLYGFPLFTDLIEKFLETNSDSGEALINQFIFAMKIILESKQKDNEDKIHMIERIQRLESEKQQCENVIARTRKELADMTNKFEKLKLTMEDFKESTRKERHRLEEEKDREVKMHQKLMIRETQLNNEIKKKEILYDKLSEQFKKFHEKQNTKSEITISYNLGKSNVIPLNGNFHDPKAFLIHEISREGDNKIKKLGAENEVIMRLLIDVYNDLIKIINDKRKNYAGMYYDVYGTDNQYLNWDISKLNLKAVNIDLDTNVFINNYNEAFEILREVISRTDELKPLMNSNNACIGSLYNDYVANLLSIIDTLHRLNCDNIYIIENIVKLNSYNLSKDYLSAVPKEIDWDILKDHQKDSEKYYENIKMLVGNNNEIFGHYLAEIEKRKGMTHSGELDRLRENERILDEKNRRSNDEVMATFRSYMNLIENIRNYNTSN
jgi:hypothetical protein